MRGGRTNSSLVLLSKVLFCGEEELAVSPTAISPVVGLFCDSALFSLSKAERNGFLDAGHALWVVGVGNDAGEVSAGEFARLRKGLLELRLSERAGGEGRRSISEKGCCQ